MTHKALSYIEFQVNHSHYTDICTSQINFNGSKPQTNCHTWIATIDIINKTKAKHHVISSTEQEETTIYYLLNSNNMYIHRAIDKKCYTNEHINIYS